MKIAVITCYKDPDYVRARTLRAALERLPGIETIVIKNSQRGLGRYAEVLRQIWRVKREERPDAYLLTFRGYEMLPFLLLLSGKTPVIFDEFINLTEWMVDEHKKMKAGSWPAKLLNQWYARQLKKCRLILADTAAHAASSARRSGLPLEKYLALPVGTDETLFQPLPHISNKIYEGRGTTGQLFQVFYYGSMLPLHGLEVVLAAAKQLKARADIHFLLVGGGATAAKNIAQAQAGGAQINYQAWINFNDLPTAIAESSLCLAGPFGNTVQSQLVITGKAYQFLACGAPIVIGKNRASGEFQNRKNALVVPQGDAEALAAAILWAADHDAELNAIAQSGQELFRQQFSLNALAKTLAPALKQL